jgi:hypothetical protein
MLADDEFLKVILGSSGCDMIGAVYSKSFGMLVNRQNNIDFIRYSLTYRSYAHVREVYA